MKTFFLFIVFSLCISAQDRVMDLHGYQVELGMNMMQVWEILKQDLNVLEGESDDFYISDKYDNPVGIIFFKDEIAVKIIKDWGTTDKTNVGQVFKTLWKIFKQYDGKLESVKVIPVETYTPKGDQTTLQFYITKNRYINILIQHNVTMYEVIEEEEN